MLSTYSNLSTGYRAIQLPFTINPQGKIASTVIPGKVWADRVLSAIGTTIGERVMRPTYGTSAGNLVFSTTSEVETVIREDVSSAFTTYLDALDLESVEFDFDELNGVVSATVYYTLPNKEEQNITMGIARISGSQPIISQEQ